MRALGKEMHTYTTSFEDTDPKISFNRDAELAKKLAKDYGSDHHEIHITKDSYLKNFTESYDKVEEPNFNISLPVYLQTAKAEGVNGDNNIVILSGDGGDEIFGGYSHYREGFRLHQQMSKMTPLIFNLVKNYRNKTHYHFQDPTDLWHFLRRLGGEASHSLTDPLKYLHEVANKIPIRDKKGFIYELMLRDRYFWLPGENFIRSDKLFMSETLEMRAPFAYTPFRRYIDSVLKEADYVDEKKNKLFVRNLYQNKLPDYIVNRSDKTGWRSPIEVWYDKKVKDLFLTLLSPMKGRGHHIDWDQIIKRVESSSTWPGKQIHLYLSLAILAQKYKIDL
jgi:asparagine synthase (glutamine-hydrolysing)